MICLKSLPPLFRKLDVVQFQSGITAGVYLLKYWPSTMKLISLITFLIHHLKHKFKYTHSFSEY